MTTRNAALAALFAGCTLLASGCMPYSTGATEVGVRTVTWSPFGGKGVQKEPYAPGSTYFFVPFFTDWHTFDTRIQKLVMAGDPNASNIGNQDDLKFKTVDGNDISLDVIISYHINPEEAAHILQRVGTDDDQVRDNIVRTIARSKPRDIFGELTTENFYEADQRSAKALVVKDKLNEMLQAYGVVVTEVLLQDYNFSPAYQQAIEDKKVADQEAEKLRSETNARREEFVTLVKEAEATIAKVKATADGEYQKAVIQADAYYLQQERIAEATLAEAQAEAEGIRKMNEALSGSGSAEVVKLAITEALADKKIIMVPMGGGGLDVRSMDMNQFLGMYGAKAIAEKKTPLGPLP